MLQEERQLHRRASPRASTTPTAVSVSEAKTAATDGFGHAQLGGLAAHLANVCKEKTGAKVRGIELSLLQRCAAHCASQTDIDESYMSGKTAVEEMLNGVTDKMVGFECDRSNGYVCRAKLFNLSDVANFEKKFPKEWITAEGNNVTEDFASTRFPLIQGETKLEKEDGLPRFARLKKVFCEVIHHISKGSLIEGAFFCRFSPL